MKSITILSFAVVLNSLLTGLNLYLMQDKLQEAKKLQCEVNSALQDNQDTTARHLKFLDSDNNKLRDDIARLRSDLDSVRYKDGR
jgi:cell division protein FtsB